MNSYRSTALGLALCFGTGCATTESTSKAPSHPERPALPAAASVPAAAPAFAPEPSLRALILSCRLKELPRDNGLDDDCDGHIDGSQPGAQVVIALSNPNQAAIALSVLGADGRELAAKAQRATDACDPQAPYAEQTRSYAGLSKGRYAVIARYVRSCAEPAASSLSLAVETTQGATAFVAQIEPDQTLTLGHFDVP